MLYTASYFFDKNISLILGFEPWNSFIESDSAVKYATTTALQASLT